MGRKRRAPSKGEVRRAGPYSRVYEPWREEWARMGLSGTQYAVMLALCQWLEFDGEGRAYAYRPRKELSDELRISCETIKQAVQALKRKGALKQKSTAHRGRAAAYWIMPALPWPTVKEASGDTQIKGDRAHTPNKKKGYPELSQRGVPTDTPITTVRGGLSASPTSSGKAPPPTADDGGGGGA